MPIEQSQDDGSGMFGIKSITTVQSWSVSVPCGRNSGRPTSKVFSDGRLHSLVRYCSPCCVRHGANKKVSIGKVSK